MACRGVYFAISDDDLAKLKAAPSDDAVKTLISDEIEERWEEEWVYETDKSWDALHRCLTDGRIGFTNGKFPLSHCVLGGEQFHRGDSYIVSLKTPEQAAAIAAALQPIDKAQLRERYFRIDPNDYDSPFDESDFEYTWNWFDGLAAFYARAAAARRHVIFTVDQ